MQQFMHDSTTGDDKSCILYTISRPIDHSLHHCLPEIRLPARKAVRLIRALPTYLGASPTTAAPPRKEAKIHIPAPDCVYAFWAYVFGL